MTDSNDAVDKLYKNYELLSSNPTEVSGNLDFIFINKFRV